MWRKKYLPNEALEIEFLIFQVTRRAVVYSSCFTLERFLFGDNYESVVIY